jgi:SSS family solute:Na+ symporter
MFGAPILGVWYWCTDQFIVQRVLAAKNIDQARKGTIFAGYLKLLPLFIFLIPGVIAFALSTGPEPLITFPVENGKPVYDAALPAMILSLLPSGMKGLVIAGMLAALMSSLSSVFNSCSTLFTIDIYQKYKPEASERQLVIVGQIATGVLVVLGLVWIPLLKTIEGGLFQKLQSIQAYISPPIAAVFLLGIFSARLNGKGAKAALIIGGVLGVVRLILELVKADLSGIIHAYADLNFLHFALLLFVICSAVLIVVSLLKPEPITEQARQLTYGKNFVSEIKGTVSAKWLSIGLIFLTIIIWIVFS